MATTSFKRKKYGMVKPVREKKVKAKKPDIRELTRYYAAIAKYGVHQQLDNVCYAMNWWDGFINWYNATIDLDVRTTSQARKLTDALQQRKEGRAANSDTRKIDCFMNSMYYLEGLARLIGFKVPILKKYEQAGEKAAKKNKAVLAAMEPRFSRITGLLTQMFPSCPLSVVVVPQIIDGVTGKDIGRKIDHTRNTIYYSRRQMKALRWTLRFEGILSLALSEAWWLARGMSFGKEQFIVDDKKWLTNYSLLLNDFEKWARRPETTSRITKKPAKPKKVHPITQMIEDKCVREQEREKRKEILDSVENHLATAEIVLMEPMNVLQN